MLTKWLIYVKIKFSSNNNLENHGGWGMNFKKTCVFLLAVLAMAILSVAATENIKAECPKKVAVVLETVKAAIFLEYQFSGQGQAEIVGIKSPVNGVLSEIKVSEGSLVDAGQDLVVLNAGMSEEIKKLAAEAAKTKKILTVRQGWKVKNEKAIQAAAKDYQKALDLLNEKEAMANLTVKAPLAGIVHLIKAVGDETATDALLLEISNPKQMVFQISLTPADAGLLTVGDKFFGTTDGFSGEVAAEVIAVSNDQATFRVNNNESQVKEGITFTFKKLEAEHADAIVIPTSVVQHDDLGDFVYVAENKKAKKLYVTLGKSRAGKTMILKGLAVDTPLIISGIECLANGKKIRIVNQEELAKEKAAALAKPEEEKVIEPEVKAAESRFRVGLTFGRFTLNDKNLRLIYPNWFQNIPGIELSVHTLYNIDVWVSGKIYSDKSKTTYYGHDLKFKLTPISVGLRDRPLKWRFFEPFVGGGVNFYSYSETISGESDLEDTKGKATGFHFQAGSYFHLNRVRLFLGEIFLKYNMVKKTLVDLLPEGTNKLDLGGLEMGIGIVIQF
jgi:membrane fusion protein (multidrug efflux system)